MDTVSFSGLESLKKCPTFFKHKYIDLIPAVKPIEKPLQVGSWSHELIEYVLKNEGEVDVLTYFKSELLSMWCTNLKLTIDTDTLIKYGNLIEDLSKLLYRASAHCKDSKLQIRNRDGSVPKDTIEFPPSTFKNALYDIENLELKSVIDNMATVQNSNLVGLSLTWMLAESLMYGTSFKIPKWVSKTLSVESEFGTSETNRVQLGNTNISLLGYIDWRVLTNENKRIILDHKTSSKCPQPLEVLIHPQLNLYAYAEAVLYGSLPDAIGIHHIKTGNYVVVETDPSIVAETVAYYTDLLKVSQQSTFFKMHPNDYQSACVKRDYKTGRINNLCPYLDICWKDIAEVVNHEL